MSVCCECCVLSGRGLCVGPGWSLVQRNPSDCGRLRLKCDGTCAETRFRLSAKRTNPFKSVGGVSSVDYWQASCAHQPAGFVLLVQACVLQSCDAYWLPTPFSCFPFTSPPVRRRVPSHFNWTLRRVWSREPHEWGGPGPLRVVPPKTKQKHDHVPILVETCREVTPYLHDHNMESRSAIQQNSS